MKDLIFPLLGAIGLWSLLGSKEGVPRLEKLAELLKVPCWHIPETSLQSYRSYDESAPIPVYSNKRIIMFVI